MGIKRQRAHWIILYSLNDYYGEQEKFIGYTSYLKDIRAIIKKQMISRSNLSWSEENADEVLDNCLKRVNPSLWELRTGDHFWQARYEMPFTS